MYAFLFKASGAPTSCMCSKWVTNHILTQPCPSPSSFPPTSTNKFIISFGGMRDGKRVCTSFEHKDKSFMEVEILGANTFFYWVKNANEWKSWAYSLIHQACFHKFSLLPTITPTMFQEFDSEFFWPLHSLVA